MNAKAGLLLFVTRFHGFDESYGEKNISSSPFTFFELVKRMDTGSFHQFQRPDCWSRWQPSTVRMWYRLCGPTHRWLQGGGLIPTLLCGAKITGDVGKQLSAAGFWDLSWPLPVCLFSLALSSEFWLIFLRYNLVRRSLLDRWWTLILKRRGSAAVIDLGSGDPCVSGCCFCCLASWWVRC